MAKPNPVLQPVARVEVDTPTSHLPTPISVNWAHFTQVGPEVQLLLGYIDALAAYKATQEYKSKQQLAKFRPDVSHRVVMSVPSFLAFRNQVEDIYKKMLDTGAIDEETELFLKPKPTDAG